jgi:hypothetical protein
LLYNCQAHDIPNQSDLFIIIERQRNAAENQKLIQNIRKIRTTERQLTIENRKLHREIVRYRDIASTSEATDNTMEIIPDLSSKSKSYMKVQNNGMPSPTKPLDSKQDSKATVHAEVDCRIISWNIPL